MGSSEVTATTCKILADGKGKLTKTTLGLEGEERFRLGKNGMYHLMENYEVGAYFEGVRDICIVGFDDQSVVGTGELGPGFGQPQGS